MAGSKDLTPRQLSILEFITDHQHKLGIAPTVREIAAHLGLTSPGSIHRILTILKDKGYIASDSAKKRSWRSVSPLPGRGIPLIGNIAGGPPTEAVERMEDVLDISAEVFGGKPCFGLRVCGDSMIEAHIMDGDLAIIRAQPRVENGQIAAVQVSDLLTEATLKIVRWTRTTLTLEPANSAYTALVFKGWQRKQVSIIGKLVGIVRKVGR